MPSDFSNLKLIFYSFSKKIGGASIAAYKFYEIARDLGFQVRFLSQDDKSKFYYFFRIISYILSKFQITSNQIKHSLNLFTDKRVLNYFINSASNVHHIHWINNDTLSIFHLNRIPKYSIITLHDEWFYCGAEHYYNVFDSSKDFIYGYKFAKKNVFGINWNYFVWKIKCKKLSNRNDLIFTVPSTWMLERSKSSFILKDLDIRLLPNPINTDIFKPLSNIQKKEFRNELSVENGKFIFAFGSFGGKSNFQKGVEYFKTALVGLKNCLPKDVSSNIILLEFGGIKSDYNLCGFRCISVGHISDPHLLSKVYSISDCLVVPSVVESFGQVPAECLSSGTPVVCFNTSGLLDIVIDNQSGFLASYLNSESLTENLLKMINLGKKKRLDMGNNGRKFVVDNYSYESIEKKYLEILLEVFEKKNVSIVGLES
jgi:glycosyltransferase involved in cell wall biosynthesis